MSAQLKETDLQNIAEGVAPELFSHELKKIAANILDINTKSTAKRKLALIFEFVPDENREEMKVHVSSKVNLAPVKTCSKTLWLGKRNGAAAIYGQDTKQLNMFDEGVVPLNQTEGAGNA